MEGWNSVRKNEKGLGRGLNTLDTERPDSGCKVRKYCRNESE